jgi:hypothetical protein
VYAVCLRSMHEAILKREAGMVAFPLWSSLSTHLPFSLSLSLSLCTPALGKSSHKWEQDEQYCACIALYCVP